VTFFSVVIPAYNRRHLLERALASVWRQTFSDYEVIVVDDGSTDGTAAYLAALGTRIKTIRQENRGPAAARNAGARIAQGTYLAFLDSDDELLPCALASYRRAIATSGNPSLLSGSLAEFKEGELPSNEGPSFGCRCFENYFSAAAEGIYVGTCHLAVRRELLMAMGGFDEALLVGEDHDLALRLGAAPGFVEIKSPPSVARRLHAGSISRNGRQIYRGVATIVQRANLGRYGESRYFRGAVRVIVSAHARSSVIGLARTHHVKYASLLYLRTLGINIRQRRWRYIAAFPLLLAWHSLVADRSRDAPAGALS
jgi:glycosyltransferase involved in cell wall biosynthesis